jgi:hypothetical protein
VVGYRRLDVLLLVLLWREDLGMVNWERAAWSTFRHKVIVRRCALKTKVLLDLLVVLPLAIKTHVITLIFIFLKIFLSRSLLLFCKRVTSRRLLSCFDAFQDYACLELTILFALLPFLL